jgi:hypothetical protein
MTSWIYMDATRIENELRVRRSEKARLAALYRKSHVSPWTLKSLLTRFGRF